MNQSVAKADNLRPRNFRIPRTVVFGDSAGSLADNFEQADEGQVQFSIAIKIDARLSFDHRLSFTCVVEHMTQANCAFMARHTGPRTPPSPDRESRDSRIQGY